MACDGSCCGGTGICKGGGKGHGSHGAHDAHGAHGTHSHSHTHAHDNTEESFKLESFKPESSKPESVDDDVWYSEGEDDHDQKELIVGTAEYSRDELPKSRTLRSLERRHAKQGYLDGLTRAKEASLQEGFDDGYPTGAKLGELVGELIVKQRASSEEYLAAAAKELAIQNVLQSKYFDENLDIEDERSHPVIKKYLDSL